MQFNLDSALAYFYNCPLTKFQTILCIIELAIAFASCSHFAESKRNAPYVMQTAVTVINSRYKFRCSEE
jgi:hypothetical protein